MSLATYYNITMPPFTLGVRYYTWRASTGNENHECSYMIEVDLNVFRRSSRDGYLHISHRNLTIDKTLNAVTRDDQSQGFVEKLVKNE